MCFLVSETLEDRQKVVEHLVPKDRTNKIKKKYEHDNYTEPPTGNLGRYLGTLIDQKKYFMLKQLEGQVQHRVDEEPFGKLM